MFNLKQALKIAETSAVSGLSAGVAVLSTDGAHLTLKTLATAGIAALVGSLYQVNRQIGVLDGASGAVTTVAAEVTKVIENQLPAPVAPVVPAVTVPAGEVFPPKVVS